MPEVVSLRIARPHGFEALGQDEWAHMVTERVHNKEAEHLQRRADRGITVLGRAGILGQKPFHCPEGHAPRFQMNPRVAAKSKWARIEAILRNRAFTERYRDAFRRHMAGLANVVFPFGTFWMRKFGKVACEVAGAVEKALLGPPMDPAAA